MVSRPCLHSHPHDGVFPDRRVAYCAPVSELYPHNTPGTPDRVSPVDTHGTFFPASLQRLGYTFHATTDIGMSPMHTMLVRNSVEPSP